MPDASDTAVDSSVDAALTTALTDLARTHSGRVLASLARRFNDLDLADEAVHEAMIQASVSWRTDGVPGNPGGWLHRVAQRKAIDLIRRSRAANDRVAVAAADIVERYSPADPRRLILDTATGRDEVEDERLRLMLLCCHSALNTEAQVALTLRLVGGLTTAEIAAAFLVPVPTLAARITRAKKKIRSANIPLSLPNELDTRIDAVLAVLYLIFNEGYLGRAATEQPMRVDLCDEAIRLCELVSELSSDHAEARGLLAMFRLTHARRDARFRDEELVVLSDQDRRAWYLSEIQAGNRDLALALPMMKPGPYQLLALIASHHTNARTAAQTEWARIVALYDQLYAIWPTAVVALNRAAAVAEADGPLAGLSRLDEVAGLDDYHLYHSTRAELLTRIGDSVGARESFERAQTLASNPSELDHLAARLNDL